MHKEFKYTFHIVFLLMLSIMGMKSYSQQREIQSIKNPPIDVETLFSNRGMTFQMMINKKLQSVPKLGFFSVTNLVGEWGENRVDDYMIQANVTYDLIKGLSLSAGFHLTPVTGIRPSAGLIYSNGTENWLFVVNPRVDLYKDGNLEGLILAEYKPKINEKWRFYSRLQGLYGYTTSNNEHARSYVMARAGLRYKEFTFGAGTNIDYYGPTKHNKNSFGGFVSLLLF